jgi:hypothetical protein
MKEMRKNLGTILMSIAAIVLLVAVAHAMSRSTPDQVGRDTATSNPQTPAAVVSTPASSTPAPATSPAPNPRTSSPPSGGGEGEDGPDDSGGDG